jgi:hypothetical protein
MSLLELRLAQQLSDYSAQGIHRTGSKVDWDSAHWLVRELKAAGVPDDAVQLREFTFEKLDPGPAFLCIEGSCTLGGLPMFVRRLPTAHACCVWMHAPTCLSVTCGCLTVDPNRTALATPTCQASVGSSGGPARTARSAWC